MTRILLMLFVGSCVISAQALAASPDTTPRSCAQEKSRIATDQSALQQQKADLDLQNTALREEAGRLIRDDAELQTAGSQLEKEQAELQTARASLDQAPSNSPYSKEFSEAHNQKQSRAYNQRVDDYNQRLQAYNERVNVHLKSNDAHAQQVTALNELTRNFNLALQQLRNATNSFNQRCARVRESAQDKLTP